MIPIHIRINKKTKTPSRNNLVFAYRYDWKTVGVISYHQTPLLFKAIDGRGKIDTDAQFAKFLRDNFGIGIYNVIAWRKGFEGFWGFCKVECGPEFYRRLPKNKSYEQKEKEELTGKYKSIKEQLKIVDGEERQELKEKMKDLSSDIDFNKELSDLDKNLKYGPGGYLKTIKPLFREHLYSGLSEENKQEEVEENFNSLW